MPCTAASAALCLELFKRKQMLCCSMGAGHANNTEAKKKHELTPKQTKNLQPYSGAQSSTECRRALTPCHYVFGSERIGWVENLANKLPTPTYKHAGKHFPTKKKLLLHRLPLPGQPVMNNLILSISFTSNKTCSVCKGGKK